MGVIKLERVRVVVAVPVTYVLSDKAPTPSSCQRYVTYPVLFAEVGNVAVAIPMRETVPHPVELIPTPVDPTPVGLVVKDRIGPLRSKSICLSSNIDIRRSSDRRLYRTNYHHHQKS